MNSLSAYITYEIHGFIFIVKVLSLSFNSLNGLPKGLDSAISIVLVGILGIHCAPNNIIEIPPLSTKNIIKIFRTLDVLINVKIHTQIVLPLDK